MDEDVDNPAPPRSSDDHTDPLAEQAAVIQADLHHIDTPHPDRSPIFLNSHGELSLVHADDHLELFLGSYLAAVDLDLLNHHRIQGVLNVASGAKESLRKEVENFRLAKEAEARAPASPAPSNATPSSSGAGQSSSARGIAGPASPAPVSSDEDFPPQDEEDYDMSMTGMSMTGMNDPFDNTNASMMSVGSLGRSRGRGVPPPPLQDPALQDLKEPGPPQGQPSSSSTGAVVVSGGSGATLGGRSGDPASRAVSTVRGIGHSHFDAAVSPLERLATYPDSHFTEYEQNTLGFYRRHSTTVRHYRECKAHDDAQYDISIDFPRIAELLADIQAPSPDHGSDPAHPPQKRILVHCIQGINRSAAIVTAFLMRCMGKSAHAAALQVVRSRPGVLTNAAFVRTLVRYGGELAAERTRTWEEDGGDNAGVVVAGRGENG